MNGRIPGYGVITAMLTPIHQDETVDVGAVKKIVNRMNDAGIHGVFTMATSGECARLSASQQELLIDTVAQANNGKSALYIGVSATGTAKAIENIRHAERAGADVIVSTLPYYYSAVTVEEQVDYYKALAESTRLPILMYNIPGNVGCHIELDAAAQLMDIENIVGIKDSSGDAAYFSELMKLRKDSYRVLAGVEAQASSAARMGADGIVPSLSNIYPRIYMDIWAAAERKDFEKVDELAAKVMRINAIHKKHRGRTAVMACRKVLLAYEGLGEEYMTKPYVPVPQELKEELLQIATELKLK